MEHFKRKLNKKSNKWIQSDAESIIPPNKEIELAKLRRKKQRQAAHAMWDYHHLIPRNKEEWTKYMVQTMRKKAGVTVLKDEDIESVVRRARNVIYLEKQPEVDPSLPPCYHWNNEEVAEWGKTIGGDDVEAMFLHNKINGRLLVHVDACALVQMGMRDLENIKKITKAIRKLLEIPPQNGLRALMRLVPFELFLKEKSKTGPETTELTFKKYCETHGFDYWSLIRTKNKCRVIPCHCVVKIVPEGYHRSGPKSDSSSDSENSERSTLSYCPTVENLARRIPIRDEMIQKVFDQLINLVIDQLLLNEKERGRVKEKSSTPEDELRERVKRIFATAYSHLGLTLEDEKADFIGSVSNRLVEDLLRTREIIEDMEEFSKHLQELGVDPSDYDEVMQASSQILEEVAPIAALLAIGELNLENVIREAPQLQQFVQEIVSKAEEEVEKKEQFGSDDSSQEDDGESVVKILSQTKIQLADESKLNWNLD